MAVYVEWEYEPKHGEPISRRGRVDGYAFSRKSKLHAIIIVDGDTAIYHVPISRLRVVADGKRR